MKTGKLGVWMSLICLLSVFGLLNQARMAQAEDWQPQNMLPTKNTLQPTGEVPSALLPAVAQAISVDAPAEYQVMPTADGYQMVNPGHGFRGQLTPDGVQISRKDGAEVWTMALTGIGYDYLQPVPAATLWAEGSRVEYRRGQTLTEWYLNSPVGLEQGLTLNTPPDGKDGMTPLRVVFTLAGDGMAEREGQTLYLKDTNGQTVLRYSGLVAWDADGKALPAQMLLSGKTLSWVVQDQGARYPVTIDPWIQQQKLTASDGAANDNFGYSVAVSGDTAVVGAENAAVSGRPFQGAAYVFVRNGSLWTLQQKLTAGDGAENDDFGYSVAISGDTVVVGAMYANVNGQSTQGAAYVFVRSGSVWTQQQKLTAGDGTASNLFGSSVSVSGDTAVVAGGGAAYVFVRNGTIWNQQAKLISDGTANDGFSESVAVSGNTALVGAPTDGGLDQGAAYVFVRSGSVWVQQQKLTAGDGQASADFGDSVAVSVDTAVVGAYQYQSGAGAAYVFVRNGTIWNQQAKLTASESIWLGHSVAVSADTAVVGVPWMGQVSQGAAYVFVRSAGVWTQQQKLTASDGAAGDAFGWSVAVSGDTAVVGAFAADVGGQEDQGAAYVFTGTIQSGNSYLLWTK